MSTSSQSENASQNGQSTVDVVEPELVLPWFPSLLSDHGFKIVAVLGAFTVLLALLTTRAEKEISKLKERDASVKIARAHEAGVIAGKAAGDAILEAGRANERAGKLAAETAKAEERTAKLETEAANARLETERLKASIQWRQLTKEQIVELSVILRKNRGTINILHHVGDVEAQSFALQIGMAFKLGGWEVNPVPVSESTRMYFKIWVDPRYERAGFLRASFSKFDIETSSEQIARPNATFGGLIDGTTTIFVGSNPIYEIPLE